MAIGENLEMIDVMSEIIACFQLVVVSKPNLNQTVTICEYLPPAVRPVWPWANSRWKH